MTDTRFAAIEYAHNHKNDTLSKLVELLAIPSISTDQDHRADIQKAALWLAGLLTDLGFSTHIYPTPGHPVVFAQDLTAGPGAPVVLIYGHYDVQPAENPDLWNNPPFQATLVGDDLFARGASDMKGQVMAVLAAIAAVKSQGKLPVNIKIIFEGEEEIGSPNLPAFLKENKDLLCADFALNPDAGMISPTIPAITYGLRGLAYFELRVYGPAHDLHSGMFGGIVHNPAQVLCDLIAGMHDKDGRITLPGFYNQVRDLDEEERADLARDPVGEDDYLEQTGCPSLWGEKNYTPIEQLSVRPTLEVNGLLSGFTGNGTKTVIPSEAMAKISSRLVPDQDPNEVDRQLRHYLEDHAPDTVRWELDFMAGEPGIVTQRDLPATKALASALETVWQMEPVFRRDGGSIPVVGQMEKVLGVSSVVTGFGLPDDNIHAPNEKLNIPTWYRGIDALIHFFYNVASSGNSYNG